MQLRHYAALLRRWFLLIALGTVLIGAATFVFSLSAQPTYRATATVFVDQSTNTNESSYGIIIASERQAQTFAQLMLTRPVLEEVAKQLGLPELKSAISVEPVQDTQLIRVDVEDTDKELATRIANTIPQVFIAQHSKRQLQKFTESRQNLDKEITTLASNIAQTQGAIAKLEALPTRTAAQEADLTRLRDDFQQYRNSYTSLVKTAEDLRLSETKSADLVSIVEPAELPKQPVRPRVLLNTILGLLVGLLVTVGGVFLVEYLDDTLKNPDDINAQLGISTLGAIPRSRSDDEFSDGDRQLVTVVNPKSPISEAYRVLRTNIQFSSVDRPVRSLLVTSANPSEGKSTTASNLAVVMAQTGQKTVLVDTDLRRPVIHKVFGVPNSAGLTNALLPSSNAASVKTLLQKTKINNLSVLTTGPLPPNPSELLGSHRMSELIGALRDIAEIIIFDSPPALAVTDSAVLARQLDGVLFVVSSGETRGPLARRSLDELRKVGTHVLGVALNRLTASKSGGYYHSYDHYYTSDADKPSRDSDRKSPSSRNKKRSGASLRLAARRLTAIFSGGRAE